MVSWVVPSELKSFPCDLSLPIFVASSLLPFIHLNWNILSFWQLMQSLASVSYQYQVYAKSADRTHRGLASGHTHGIDFHCQLAFYECTIFSTISCEFNWNINYIFIFVSMYEVFNIHLHVLINYWGNFLSNLLIRSPAIDERVWTWAPSSESTMQAHSGLLTQQTGV